MALQFHEDIAASKDADQPFQHLPRLFFDGSPVALPVKGGQWTFVATRKTNQAARVRAEFIVGGERIFGLTQFGGYIAQLGTSDEAAEILIARTVFSQQGKPIRFRCVDLRTNQGTNVAFLAAMWNRGAP